MEADTAAMERARERLLPSLWCERRRVIRRAAWTFDGREYLRDIMDDFSERVIVRKAAQVGATELAQNMLVHAVDFGVDAMCVFPTDDTAKRHSKARFDALIEESPYIREIFQEVDSVDVKRSLDTALYFEGSNSGDALYSVPVGLLVVDERDRCNQDALHAAEYRLTGQERPRSIWMSTPTIPEFGIDSDWRSSDQKEWIIEHGCGWRGSISGDSPALSEWTSIEWEGKPKVPATREESERIAATAVYVCPGCGVDIDDERRKMMDAGEWVAGRPESPVSGYAISQAMSPTVSAVDITRRYFAALLDLNPERLRQFVNQTLGLPFVGEGERISDSDVARCVVPRGTVMPDLRCAGIDVGKKLHVALGGLRGDTLIVRKTLTLDSFEELDALMAREDIRSAVIDAYPETRKAEEWCERWPIVGYRAAFPEARKDTYNFDIHRQWVDIRRVDAVDLQQARVLRDRFKIWEGGDVEELKRHLTRIQVTLEKDRNGVPRRVVHGKLGGADDYAFACLFLECAASRVPGELDSDTIEADPALGRSGHDLVFDHQPDPCWSDSRPSWDSQRTYEEF